MSRNLLLVALLLPACGSDPTPQPQWYFTCGDPVCGGHQTPPGMPPCTFETPGEACRPEGAACDPIDECNRRLVCATSDPAQAPGGCPISSIRLERDAECLREAELRRLYDERTTVYIRGI